MPDNSMPTNLAEYSTMSTAAEKSLVIKTPFASHCAQVLPDSGTAVSRPRVMKNSYVYAGPKLLIKFVAEMLIIRFRNGSHVAFFH